MRWTIMLGAGLIARHATLALGRRLAAGSPLTIPRLCSYATAGIGATMVRAGLDEWTPLEGVPVWMAFGVAWGLIAGLMLPFARRTAPQ